MKKLLLSLAFMMLSVVVVFADSPLTSTDFYKAYLDVPVVKQASQSKGVMTEDIFKYLSNDDSPIDIRLAVVNALGFGHEDNSTLFLSKLAKKYGTTIDNVQGKYNYWECVTYIYMTAMGFYDNNEILQSCMDKFTNMPNAEMQSDAVVQALIFSQINMNNEGALRVKFAVEISPNDEFMRQDMRPEALKIVWDYMKLYYTPQASIWIISKSKNPYKITINGKVLGKTDPYERYEYKCTPGYYHIEAKQVSGYTFYPTENRTDINVESVNDSFEFIIGVE